MQIILPPKYTLVANYENRYVLACSKENTPEPWVVWYIGLDFAPHTGSYYKDRESAENKFCSTCFDWFKEVEI